MEIGALPLKRPSQTRRKAIAVVHNAVVTSFLLAALAAHTEETSGAAESEVSSPPQAETLSIGAYYYPWYEPPRPGRLGWTSQSLRGRLAPPQLPKLGVYDSRDPAVIADHIAQSRRAGIDFWAVSWWGPGGREDRAFHDHILTHPAADQLRYAVLYESTGRLGRLEEPVHDNLLEDFAYLKERFFDHPLYLKVEGKPVVFLYLTRVYFRDRGHEALAQLRRIFPNLYLIGDDVFGPRYSEDYARSWDAVTAYDVYGQSFQAGGATRSAVQQLYKNYANAKALAQRAGAAFVPAVAPGYNDRAVREGHPGRPRYFTDDEKSKDGDVFRALIRDVAVPLADPKTNRMVMVTSFNEWYEDTQIEATAGGGSTTKDDSGPGDFYTEGDRYLDYGTLYLDILQEEKRAAARGKHP